MMTRGCSVIRIVAAANAYFAAIPTLADSPKPLGYRAVKASLAEAEAIIEEENDLLDQLRSAQLVGLWS